jgi:hypothetical protein
MAYFTNGIDYWIGFHDISPINSSNALSEADPAVSARELRRFIVMVRSFPMIKYSYAIPVANPESIFGQTSNGSFNLQAYFHFPLADC